jgi:O-antigen/teichoic acid export membrane protein
MRADPSRTRADLGPIWVACGLGLFGLSNFVFLALVGRDLGPAASAPVSVAWTVLNALGIGLFQPLEQETGRRLAASRATGRGANVVTAVRFGVVASAVVLVVGLALMPWLADVFFGSAQDIVVVVVLGLVGQALAYYARGVLAGQGRFVRYGAQLGVDGALRIVLAGALFALPDASRLSYGLVLVLAPVVATLVTASPRALLHVGRGHRDLPRGAGIGALVAASTAAQVLANLGPIAMAALATPAQQGLSGRFVAAVTVARIPLFLFAAVQAVFLPSLAGHIARHDVVRYRTAVRGARLAALALAVSGVAGVWLLGEQALALIYGPEFAVGLSTLVVVAVSGGVFMLAQVQAQALLAHEQERVVALAWAAGVVGALVSLPLPGTLDLRVAVALTIGSAVSFLALTIALRRTDRRWDQLRREALP